MIAHPYVKYGMALVMHENGLHIENDICVEHIVDEITKGLNTFRMKPSANYEGKETTPFIYTEEDGSAKDFKFLSPHVVSTDMQARNVRSAALNYMKEAKSTKGDFLAKADKVGMSEVPIVGEYTSFSKTIGRGASKATKLEQGLGLVTTLTQYKPSISNSCLIPDLEIEEMVDFISVFKRLLISATDSLFIGSVKTEETKGIKKYIPKRPKIYRGNFPNAPFSTALGSIALLGAIGELCKEEAFSEIVKRVLESLRGKSIYIIRYGDATSFSYNNCIIELAKEARLSSVVDSIFYSCLYNQERRSWGNTEYEKFDMFASRFLQLFNRPSFMDFFSFRAEYPSQIEILFTTYFERMENIDKSIIESAKCLGQWLNWVAYKAASDDAENHLTLQQRKAKILVELESSVFAAKTADALIAQTVTRAGRLSGRDAPAGSEQYVLALLSGDIELNVAKNLLVAFSRIKSSKASNSEDDAVLSNDSDIEEDYSQI